MHFKVLTNAARATHRHPREGEGPGSPRKTWNPAFAGMTFVRYTPVLRQPVQLDL
jgi:hypothetical protein